MDLYKNQVKLLLDVIPIVSNESMFALFGGTAINLFVRNMPRLSVDIDLTYVPIEDDFDTGRMNIENGLNRIKTAVEKSIPRVSVSRQKDKKGDIKLNIQTPNATIKVEVNPTGRGLISPAKKLALCNKTQEEFDVFCSINVVSLEQLYGGKICAALDRQHPRDLFDVKYLLENEGFTDQIKKGFIYSLLCSGRPIHEVIDPNLKDERQTMKDHFDGMTTDIFTYENYEEIRSKLISIVKASLTDKDKDFIVQFDSGTPSWNQYDFSMMPGVKWKLKNLTENLIPDDPKKHQLQHEELIRKLYA
jgi:predicted nucleotidyltransferase component of viral defense system